MLMDHILRNTKLISNCITYNNINCITYNNRHTLLSKPEAKWSRTNLRLLTLHLLKCIKTFYYLTRFIITV